MNIHIQSPGFTLSPELTGFVQAKVGKLFNYSNAIISISMILKVVNSATKENKRCEIRVAIPGNDILASAQCATFEEAVLEITATIKNRITRKKTKILGTRNDMSIGQLLN